MGAGNFKNKKVSTNRYGSKGGGKGSGYKSSDDKASVYVGAPYNFVPFSEKVYEYPQGKQVMHDRISDELFTGELTYEIEAKTPILIDNGKGAFVKDAQGRNAIPGSTMRGLIRSNVQVLGLAGYEDDIDDYALMYRDVTNKAKDDRYKTILDAKPVTVNDAGRQYRVGALLEVRAGYVKNEGGTYTIYKTCVDSIRKEFRNMNYYILSERKIINDYLKHPDHFSYQVFRPNGKSILQHEFVTFDRYENARGVHYKGTPNKEYRPYHIPVSYEVKNLKDISAVGKPGEYTNEGYAVSTGKMNEKKVLYIIPKIDKKKETITIPEKDVRAFRIDLNKREKTLKQFGGKKHFDLPSEGEEKPIFYVEQPDGRLYFGFTPRLRLFYDHTVREGLNQKCKKDRIDYNRAIFGYAGTDGSFRSKVSFSDAVVTEGAKAASGQQLILAEPKPTSYFDYLKQPQNLRGPANTYNTDGFTLRGAKQYWLHTKAPVNTAGMNRKNEKVVSGMHPLAQGVRFRGKIRFQNMTQDELGLLLWAVRLDSDCWMNVGKAKAYGYGVIALNITEAKALDLKKAYDQIQTLELQPFRNICVNEMITAYQESISRFLGGRKITDLPHIKDFFHMKDSRHIPDDKQTRYMDLKSFGSRRKALPLIEEVVKRQ